MSQNLSDQDYELLSAYLDGELSEAEQTQVEARLLTEPLLRWELAALREVKQLVSALPVRPAPRSYALDERTARRLRKPPRLLGFPATAAFSALSTAAATLLLILAGVIFLNTTMVSQSPQAASSVAIAPTEMALQAAQTEPEVDQNQSITAAPTQMAQPTMAVLPTEVGVIELPEDLSPGAPALQGSAPSTMSDAIMAAPAVESPSAEEALPSSTQALADTFSSQPVTTSPEPEALREMQASAAEAAAGIMSATAALSEMGGAAESAQGPIQMENAPLMTSTAVSLAPPASESGAALPFQPTQMPPGTATVMPPLLPTSTSSPAPSPTPAPTATPIVVAAEQSPLQPSLVLAVALVLIALALFGFALATTWLRRKNRQ